MYKLWEALEVKMNVTPREPEVDTSNWNAAWRMLRSGLIKSRDLAEGVRNFMSWYRTVILHFCFHRPGPVGVSAFDLNLPLWSSRLLENAGLSVPGGLGTLCSDVQGACICVIRISTGAGAAPEASVAPGCIGCLSTSGSSNRMSTVSARSVPLPVLSYRVDRGSSSAL